MTSIRFNILLMLFVAILGNLKAQDIHLLQYNASPQNLNPAQTGLFNGDWRFVGNYRNQWLAIPVPYNTYSISTDMRLNTLPTALESYFKNIVPALGLLINHDKAGDSKLQTTQIYLSASIIKKLDKDSTHFISVGAQPGISNKNFSTNELTFDKQYDGSSYNSSLSNGENFGNTGYTYFDIGAGASYYWEKSERKKINTGLSFFHINTPKQSYFQNNGVKLDLKFNFTGIAEYPVAPKIGILPTFLFQRQGKFQEMNIGVYGKYYLAPINGAATAVSLGLFNRAKDAWVVVAKMDYRNFNVGVSYDVNISDLTTATNKRGAFELSIIYILKKEIPFIAKYRVCPIDM